LRLTLLLTLVVFALTLFVSATLLFLVELMIGKMILPLLGGTPAVWNTCMVFFQASLLVGYAYAHVTLAALGARKQAALQLFLLVLPFLVLPIAVKKELAPQGEGSQVLGVLVLLIVSVGPPFFVLSTSAPLLQKWFADTSHPAARDPYFLYAASNLGSMVGLLSYPILVEPYLSLSPRTWLSQSWLWTAGYVLLVALSAACAVILWRSPRAAPSDKAATSSRSTDRRPLTTARRLRWVALAFVPSSLMLGATTYITTDIAAIPLLWMPPLALYLLSFILVFSRMPPVIHRILVALMPLLILLTVFLMLSEIQPPLPWFSATIWLILLHLILLFVVAMVCHGELARSRPDVGHLTEFYLWMSVGGVLGGLFNALVAPLLFDGVVEYPLAMVLACLLMPSLEGEAADRGRPLRDMGLLGFYLGLAVVLIGLVVALYVMDLSQTDLSFAALGGLRWLWLAALVLTGLCLVRYHVLANREERVVRWLDLGLPAALGLLVVGFSLVSSLRYLKHWLDQ
jgi:hypothetical protein